MFSYLIIVTILWVLYMYFAKHQFVVGKVTVEQKSN